MRCTARAYKSYQGDVRRMNFMIYFFVNADFFRKFVFIENFVNNREMLPSTDIHLNW